MFCVIIKVLAYFHVAGFVLVFNLVIMFLSMQNAFTYWCMDSPVVRIVNKWIIALGMFVIVWISMHLMLNNRNTYIWEKCNIAHWFLQGHCSFVSLVKLCYLEFCRRYVFVSFFVSLFLFNFHIDCITIYREYLLPKTLVPSLFCSSVITWFSSGHGQTNAHLCGWFIIK